MIKLVRENATRIQSWYIVVQGRDEVITHRSSESEENRGIGVKPRAMNIRKDRRICSYFTTMPKAILRSSTATMSMIQH